MNDKTIKINMDYASKIGDVEELKRLKTNGYTVSYYGMALASRYGHTNVLDWWKTNGIGQNCINLAIEWASQFDQIDVLEWWYQSGLELDYSELPINWAAENSNIRVLEWWITSGLVIKYKGSTVYQLLKNNHLFMLNHLISINT